VRRGEEGGGGGEGVVRRRSSRGGEDLERRYIAIQKNRAAFFSRVSLSLAGLALSGAGRRDLVSGMDAPLARFWRHSY
jgi:hypothetical protein